MAGRRGKHGFLDPWREEAVKKLRLYNGAGWGGLGDHLYIAAYSVKDAVALMNEAELKVKGYTVGTTVYRFNTYFHKGHWGTSTNGITPERGVWLAKNGYEKPERVL
jgi:hypothetical protein